MEPLPEVTEAYVKSLADPLISHTTEPIDTMSVLAIACRAALFEAWEQVRHGETHLRMFPNGVGVDVSHGEIMAGKRIIHRVADALRLMTEVKAAPDPEPDPQYLAAEALYGHPLQYALVGGVYVGGTQDMDDAAVRAEAGPSGVAGLTVERYNRCPTCEEWSPCDMRSGNG